MSADFDTLARLFDAARVVPRGDRAAHLARCGADPSTAETIERLLEIDSTPPTELGDAELGWRARHRIAQALDPVSRVGERFDRYTLLEVIGQGGSGIVYRACHDALDRICALKLLAVQLDGTDASRFESEARIMARLEHPAIAHVFDAGTFTEGATRTPFIAMEFVDGPPITEFAARHRLDSRERVQLLLTVAAALDHAHRSGCVHRDVKPANVLVEGGAAAPKPKLVDFGIATLFGAGAPTAGASPMSVAGTRRSMSPEQARGDPAAIDGRSDVYSLAVLATDLLGPAATERRVARLLRSAQAHDPTDRPSTAMEFATQLDAAVRARGSAVDAARVTMATLIALVTMTGVVAVTPALHPSDEATPRAMAPHADSADTDASATWSTQPTVNPIDVAFGFSEEHAERLVREFTFRITASPIEERLLRMRRAVTNLRLGHLEDARRDIAWVAHFNRTAARPSIEFALQTIIALGWIELESGRPDAALAFADRRPFRDRREGAFTPILYEFEVVRAACLVGTDDCEGALRVLDSAQSLLEKSLPVSDRVRDIAAVTRIEACRRLGRPIDISVERPHPHAQRIAAAL